MIYNSANLLKSFKKFTRLFFKTTKKFKTIFEKIQLTILYFFAFAILIFTLKNALGTFPIFLGNYIPFTKQILKLEFLSILTAPEKTFLLYLLAIEFIIIRPVFNFSMLVKFNFLFIFILEMLQNLMFSYVDLFFNRELDIFKGRVIIARYAIANSLSLFFVFFFFLYLYCYIRAMQGLFPRIPGFLGKVIESVAFWLRLKFKPQTKKK